MFEKNLMQIFKVKDRSVYKCQSKLLFIFFLFIIKKQDLIISTTFKIFCELKKTNESVE
jgi:hypothetical protein